MCLNAKIISSKEEDEVEVVPGSCVVNYHHLKGSTFLGNHSYLQILGGIIFAS